VDQSIFLYGRKAILDEEKKKAIPFILFENLFKPRQRRLAVLKYSLWLVS